MRYNHNLENKHYHHSGNSLYTIIQQNIQIITIMRSSTSFYQLTLTFLLLLVSPMYFSQQILITKPTQLAISFNSAMIPMRMSPIGFRPKTGTLHGRIILSQPSSACGTDIKSIQDYQEDIFVLVDDEGCLQSVKAKNVANSGAFMMIIKRNIYNTLKDKQSNTVHIPVAQIQPSDWNKIHAYILNNTQSIITSQADFTSLTSHPPKQLNLQLWLSPTQKQAYEYLSQLTPFLTQLSTQASLQFKPHFVLHSQNRQMQYLGCLSNGRYCAPQLQYEGQPQSAKIVSQALRQIVILQTKGVQKWMEYSGYYFVGCLGVQLGLGFNGKSSYKVDKGNLWKDKNSQMCSEGAMISAGIDAMQIFKQYNDSFLGPRPQVDPNTYLQQQLQLYQSQPPNSLPSITLNSKQFPLQFLTPLQLKLRICNAISPNPDNQPSQCQKITNPSLFSSGQILIIIAILINALVCLMIICKQVIKRKMKEQIQQEVSGTLDQYYKYMNMDEDVQVNVNINGGNSKGNQEVSFDQVKSKQRNNNNNKRPDNIKPSVQLEEFSYS